MTRLTHLALAAAAAVLAACAGSDADTETDATSAAPAAAMEPAGGPQTPDPGRRVVVVELVTDEQGNNVFRPARFEVHRGDVVRWTLVSGVHNVHFVADSNANAVGLPATSDMLQLPGQTWDTKITLAPGDYYFQCDPHALLGMVGSMEVEDEDD